jgi:hypothetical protein
LFQWHRISRRYNDLAVTNFDVIYGSLPTGNFNRDIVVQRCIGLPTLPCPFEILDRKQRQFTLVANGGPRHQSYSGSQYAKKTGGNKDLHLGKSTEPAA